ncbi:formate dehydrogenase subunit gamma [Paracoccus sp. Z118]|uniref:formate dehydrogenase subunit gamma n=1 Tax=Paracoccus sp. Z118 TaxID=2851017 RepID=UPI001C2C845C|nr:formate dehydrogenase subunit gamma [Paracoccus sp. Z118]MBV0892084.1 formate dehydrogenase subunit gamma [Paracoccus sp. Z118]
MQSAPALATDASPDEGIRSIVSAHIGREGPLLPILHDVQHAFGHIPATAVPLVAQMLNISRAEVHGVVSFYHDFREAPAGRHVLKLCRAEACQARGAAAVEAAALDALGLDGPGTTADGAVTVEPVYCLGLCACGPAAMLDGRPVARLDEDRVTSLLREMRA